MPRTADRADGAIVAIAPAKVNLFLELLARRPDGFHTLETLMVAVSLADRITAMPADELMLTCDDPTLPTGADNLVVRAATALARSAGVEPRARLHLEKRIPAAAGLAGGSSDAAATLVALDRLWNLGLSRDRLRDIAATVGSDVAFFLEPPAAWCTGRGEMVEPAKPGGRLHFVLVCPAEGISTAEVYRQCAVPAAPRSGDAVRAAFASGDIDAIGKELFNRLQEPAERICPRVGELRERLARLAPASLMSGSGSTLFALCRDHRSAVGLAGRLRADLSAEPRVRVFVVRSLIPERT
ncbi:MAG: 4-(cytidine 5'-diphospho)-2-C-methyl-D-erythritol kinase [Gemmataceae bacterium]|nr:4-(cytidine 5'-diphospho)-2-C-methyl-D-erythritol kinase [Gemmataceae bacterium]